MFDRNRYSVFHGNHGFEDGTLVLLVLGHLVCHDRWDTRARVPRVFVTSQQSLEEQAE